jgi:predicted DNA-binding protein (MmcQ/YjbR family)
VVLKADPEDSNVLRQSHRDITPGYHMNKKHWITLEPGETVDKGLVRELVTDSYRLVVADCRRRSNPSIPRASALRVRITDDAFR